jgi:hypothetical protein
MKYSVENKVVEKKIEGDIIYLPEKITFKKPVDKKEQLINIQRFSMEVIKRELTQNEVEEYLKLFVENKTNLWSFLNGKK